ncbi:MAG: RecX family transcriptional regulator [Candidatus Dormibacteraeota bacterium]|nr:RecX family transcriptional regulator [Candidatus Dormibacteraeota bacterium]
MTGTPLSPRAEPAAESDRVDAYLSGVRLLGFRAHSTRELSRKLERRGYSAEEIEVALARLTAQRYLDDVEFGRGLANRRGNTRGAVAVAAELAAKGVPRPMVQEILADRDPELEIAGAERLARSLLGRARGESEPGSLQSLLEIAGPRLLRRGYRPNVIREACRRALAKRTA